MDSVTLKDAGFAEWQLLKNLSVASLTCNTGCVFLLRDITLTGKSGSDVLYIGRTKNTARKILGGYIGGYGGRTARKINNKLNEGYIEKTEISFKSTDNPKTTQKELLDKFKKENGAYPSWNLKKDLTAKPSKLEARPSRKEQRAPRSKIGNGSKGQ